MFPAWRAGSQAGHTISGARLLGLLSACFVLHAVLRRAVSETAGIDDVDQILRAQIWSWGYGPQPPLYTWLTKIFLDSFGSSVLSLLLLKELIMFCIYGLVYGCARKITGTELRAVLATMLLMANFSVSWESHRELTHTVLVSLMSVATLYCLLSLTPDKWAYYWMFGLCTGLGMLSKYNYAILWVALALSALSFAEFRAKLLNRKMGAALLFAATLCAPHFLWVYHHRALAFSSVAKLQIVENGNLELVAVGLEKWILAILAHIGPMVGILAIAYHRKLNWFANATPSQKLLLRALCWILIIVTLNITVFRVTGVRDRYVQPLFIWLPVLLVTAIREPMPVQNTRCVIFLGLLAAGIILLAAPGRVLLTERLKKNEVLNTPCQALARDLAPAIASADCVIAENHALAGNLRLWFPNKLILDPEVGPLFNPGPRTSLLVWNADANAKPPSELCRFARSFAGEKTLGPMQIVEERLKYHHHRTIQIGVALTR